LIYYDAALVLCPQILLGSLIGIFGNVILPDYMILIFIVLLLSFVGYKSAKESYNLWKVEYRTVIDDSEIKLLKTENASPLTTNGQDYHDQKYPLVKYLVFILMLAVLLLIILIGGGSDASVIGTPCGSLSYLGIYLCAVPVMVEFTALSGMWLHRNQKYEQIDDEKEKTKLYPYHIKWNKKNLMLWPAVAVLAGFSAALVGIGGGSIQGPVLLAMGLSPQVSVVTSAFMITFTGIANIIQYFMLNLITWEEAIWYGAVGIVGAVVGHNVVGYIVLKWKKQFFVSCLLATMVMVSCSALLFQIISKFVKNEFEMGFSPLCKQ